MSLDNSSHSRRGFGARGVESPKAPPVKAKPERRMPTYAELSVPGPDEVPPPSDRTIWKDADSFWLRIKWQIVLFGMIGILYLLQGAFFSGVENAAKQAGNNIGRELRSLASQCSDPTARKRLEEAGWTVRVSPNGGCRISAPQK